MNAQTCMQDISETEDKIKEITRKSVTRKRCSGLEFCAFWDHRQSHHLCSQSVQSTSLPRVPGWYLSYKWRLCNFFFFSFLTTQFWLFQRFRFLWSHIWWGKEASRPTWGLGCPVQWPQSPATSPHSMLSLSFSADGFSRTCPTMHLTKSPTLSSWSKS